MKKFLLTIISVLIIVLSIVLFNHIATNETDNDNQTIYGENITLSDISSDIDNIILNEDNEIEIGEMI